MGIMMSRRNRGTPISGKALDRIHVLPNPTMHTLSRDIQCPFPKGVSDTKYVQSAILGFAFYLGYPMIDCQTLSLCAETCT